MGAPQIIVIVLLVLGWVEHIEHHGQPIDMKYNAGLKFITSIISAMILWWGGFWG